MEDFVSNAPEKWQESPPAPEASAENHAMLAVNCESFAVVECHHAAVWRSDAGAGVLHWSMILRDW
jgi:hypothetical protein